MDYYCDCPICNMTEEGHQESEYEFIKWHYTQYCEETKNPLSMDEWLKSINTPK